MLPRAPRCIALGQRAPDADVAPALPVALSGASPSSACPFGLRAACALRNAFIVSALFCASVPLASCFAWAASRLVDDCPLVYWNGCFAHDSA
eukprot:8909630-Alexandrium_andersonii.AAC.1